MNARTACAVAWQLSLVLFDPQTGAGQLGPLDRQFRLALGELGTQISDLLGSAASGINQEFTPALIEHLANVPANMSGFSNQPPSGVQLRRGARQSIPSSSIENCAAVSATDPSRACGHRNLPRSSRLANRHRPWPSHHSTLIRSPRRPRNTNSAPPCGSSSASAAPAPPACQSPSACPSPRTPDRRGHCLDADHDSADKTRRNAAASTSPVIRSRPPATRPRLSRLSTVGV